MSQVSGLEFSEPDLTQFPCLRIALQAARRGGSACCVLSAANDVAVRAYLEGVLHFSQIAPVIAQTLSRHVPVVHQRVEQVLASDAWARQVSRDLVATQANGRRRAALDGVVAAWTRRNGRRGSAPHALARSARPRELLAASGGS